MNELTVLVTAGGSPGAPGIIKSLKLNKERKIKVVCTDLNKDSAGLYLADVNYIVPSGKSEEYISRMMEIAIKEKVDVIIPLSTPELFPMSINKKKFESIGTKIAISDPEQIKIANDRAILFEKLSKNGFQCPKYELVNNFKAFEKAVYNLGYPEVPVCIKKRIGNGGRGFRILDEKLNKLDLLLNHKPDNTKMTLNDLAEVLENVENFPDLLVMEYLPGKEYSVDVLAKHGSTLAIVPRLRGTTRMGVSYIGYVEENNEVINMSCDIIKNLKFDYNANIQLKYSVDNILKLVEINPRMSGTIVLCTAAGVNIPYLTVKMAMSEELPYIKPNYNVKMVRYLQEVFLDPDGNKLY